MSILQRSSPEIFDCLIKEMAVTRVSIAPAKSPELASCTALLIALLDTVLLRWKISANSASLIIGGGGSCLIGLWRLSSRSLSGGGLL